jgi:hypothetical protein
VVGKKPDNFDVYLDVLVIFSSINPVYFVFWELSSFLTETFIYSFES